MSISTPDPDTGQFLAGYASPAESYDELLSSPGVLRPHWRHLAQALKALGPAQLARAWEQARRNLRESGVTYNPYGDPAGVDRPWELDPIPFLISAREWTGISAGLAQRARLFNAIVADVYGPQRLAAEGLLPTALLYSHPIFLRPCHGMQQPHDVWLHLYGADLVRSPLGEWFVQADRTQSPSGAGYAVENRIVISRMLPGVFHDHHVERLAPFFVKLREHLQNLAPRHRDNPRIVLLSAGPRRDTYFEDAYLARYLGYTLVEGGDLAVRDDAVFLKTLGGLVPVDVILRRLADEDCDPLELRSDSVLGVAGLLSAIRAGNVAVANAPGSGFCESPALMPYVPAICRALLGEELRLPSVATWWCGDPMGLDYVLAHLDRLVVAPAFRRSGMTPVVPLKLSEKDRAQLIARIRARPQIFVGRELATLSAAPVWDGGGLAPRHLALRTYLTAVDRDYAAMPGGLARMSATPAPLSASMAAGRGSKDAWILSEGPVQPVSLLHPAGQPVELRRSGSELPSRVADNLFWLGRLAERAEGAARLLRSVLLRLTSEVEPGAIAELPVLLDALAERGELGPIASAAADHRQWGSVESEVRRAMFDERQASSLHSTLTALHRTASIVRDRISIDAWRILNQVEQDFVVPADFQRTPLGDVLLGLNQLIVNLTAFSGLGTESMTRTQGWRFLDIGRRLERAVHMIGLLKCAVAPVFSAEGPVLEATLEVADSSMTYRARYLSTLQTPPVVDLLLTDETNPRSVAFQLAALATHVEYLPRDLSNPVRTQEQRLTLSMLTSVRLAEVYGLCESDDGQRRRHLENLLVRLGDQLPRLSDSLSQHYLIHAGPSRQLGEIRTEPTP